MKGRSGPEAVIASAIRELRLAIGWSQGELAARAHRSRDRPLQRDPAHARTTSYVVGRLRRSGWDVRTEVEIGGDRSRGWIDVLAWHPTTGLVLVIELKTELHDLGEVERRLGGFEREAWRVPRAFGARPTRVVGCLLLLATESNDLRASANRASLEIAFPMRWRSLGAVLETGSLDPRPAEPTSAPDPAQRRLDAAVRRSIGLVDPRSRRRVWIRPLRVDGRRSPAPYVDYAAFMRSLVSGTGSAARVTRSGARQAARSPARSISPTID